VSGIDIYFSKSIKFASGKPAPDLSLNFGEISDDHHGGTGTGLSPNDYVSIPIVGTDGLLITAKGDATNKILLIPYSFFFKGFLETIITRGHSDPIDEEPAVSTIAIADCAGC